MDAFYIRRKAAAPRITMVDMLAWCARQTKTGLLAYSILLGLSCVLHAAQNQNAVACAKDCSDYRKACRQAHSAQACNSEFNICMGFCRKK